MISSRLSEMPWGAAIENNGIERRQNPWLFLTVKIVIDQCRRPEAGAIAKVGKKRTCKFSNRKLQFEPASLRVLKRDGEGEGRGEGVSPLLRPRLKFCRAPSFSSGLSLFAVTQVRGLRPHVALDLHA